MRLRIRRSGRHRTPATEAAPYIAALNTELASDEALAPLRARLQGDGRCQGTTRNGRCLLEAGSSGYCVFHQPKDTP